MKYLISLSFFLVGFIVSAQVFSVRETYFPTRSNTGIIYINKDSIYFAAKYGFVLTSVNNNLKWYKNIFVNSNCLHLENTVLDFVLNQKNQIIGVLDIRESCSQPRGIVANVDSNENWRVSFDIGYSIDKAKVYIKQDTTYVYYVSYDNPATTTQLLIIDSLGVVNEKKASRFPIVEKDEDSLYVLGGYNGNQYIGTTYKGSGYFFRPIVQIPSNGGSIVKAEESGDTLFSILSKSTNFWVRESGVGYNLLNGSTSKWLYYEKKDRLEYLDFVLKDDFIIIAEHDRISHSVLDVNVTVYDKKLNFRHKFKITSSTSKPSSIKVLDDSTLFVSLQNGTLYFLDMDLKQMPLAQLPEDKEADPVNFVEEVSLKPQTTLFPNPTTTHFTLQSTQNINRIQVFDLRGALVLEQTVQSTEHQVQLSEAGTYIIHIHLQDGSTERQKVVKMKE